MSNLRFVPEFHLDINGRPVPATLRASIASVSYQTGLEGSDRVELALVNDNLRWLDHRLLALDNRLKLAMGYTSHPLDQVFVGEIVGQTPSFPSTGSPMLTVVAQDRRQRLQEGTQTRWFALSIPSQGNYPLPDIAVASMVAAEHGLMPVYDPIGAVFSLLIGGAQVVVALANNEPQMMQALIRKQVGESNLDFLQRIARENNWEMTMEHSGAMGGLQLRFSSPADHLKPDVTLKYGQSLVDFHPRITKVGQVAGVTVKIWQADTKTEFAITASWDWDRNSLDVKVAPANGQSGTGQSDGSTYSVPQAQTSSGVETPSIMLVDEPLNQISAPRVLLSKLLPRLNNRLTGSGSTVGNPRIKAGAVLRLEGLGSAFGGLYRVTSATHTIDGGGYRTSFEVRKEIWFGSIPLSEQGAVPLNIQGQRVAG